MPTASEDNGTGDDIPISVPVSRGRGVPVVGTGILLAGTDSGILSRSIDTLANASATRFTLALSDVSGSTSGNLYWLLAGGCGAWRCSEGTMDMPPLPPLGP